MLTVAINGHVGNAAAAVAGVTQGGCGRSRQEAEAQALRRRLYELCADLPAKLEDAVVKGVVKAIPAGTALGSKPWWEQGGNASHCKCELKQSQALRSFA